MPEILNRQIPQINSVNVDVAGVWVIQAAEEFVERTFACTIRTDDCRDLTGRDGEVEIVKGQLVTSGIMESDFVESDALFQG